jgi:nucleosome-remodeling factor subunit BPTF
VLAALPAQPEAAPASNGGPASVPNAPAGGFAGLLAALLAEAGTPATPSPTTQNKPDPARPAPKREPGDDLAVLSLAAALLPPLPAPPPLAPFVAGDAIGTGNAAGSGPSAPATTGVPNLLDSAPLPPAPSGRQAAAALVENRATPIGTAPDNIAPESSAPANIASGSTALENIASDDLEPASFALTGTVPTSIVPESTPADDTAPAGTAPTSFAPDDIAAPSTAPESAAPDDITHTSTVPIDLAPTKLASTDLAPTKPAPTDLAPTDLAPTKLAPTDLVPTDLVPTDLAPTKLAPTDLAPTSVAPVSTSAAPKGAPRTASAPGPAVVRNQELAFGLRLAASAEPAERQPASYAPSSPIQGSGQAIPAGDSSADRVTSPAAENKPLAAPDRQPAEDGTPAQDPISPDPPQPERSPAAAIQTARPAPGQGASNQARDQESRRPLAGASLSESGSAAAFSTAAPAASLQPLSEARQSAPQTAAPAAPEPPEAPREQPREPAVRELSLDLRRPSTDGRDSGQVSLRVVERGGEVQVAVRTTDPQLAGDLRQNLPDLVSELSGRGYRAETWQPLASSGAEASALPRAASTAADSGAGQNYSGQTGDGSRNGGSPAGQQQQQQRHGQDPSQPSWLQALNRSAAQTGSTPYDDYTD